MRIMPAHRQPRRPAINRQPRRCGLCGAARHFPFDFGWEARIASGVVDTRECAERARARLAKRGALGGASVISTPHQTEPASDGQIPPHQGYPVQHEAIARPDQKARDAQRTTTAPPRRCAPAGVSIHARV